MVYSATDPNMTCGNERIKPALFDKLGYGIAMDADGNGYVVRLMTTKQISWINIWKNINLIKFECFNKVY